MIRLIITVLFLVVFFIFSIPMFGILWVIGRFNKPKKDIIALRIVQWAFKVIRFLCGVKRRLSDMRIYQRMSRYYMSAIIIAILTRLFVYSMLPGLTGFVAKKEMEKDSSFAPLDEAALLPVP